MGRVPALEAAAVNVRRKVSLRLSVTDRCSLRCFYCMPPDGVTLRPRDRVLRFEEIARFVRIVASRYEPTKVHLTGGEPLLRRDIVRLVQMLAREGPRDLALTTNGLRLAALAGPLKAAGLRRANVSLDSLDPATFAAITGTDALGDVLDGIRAARTAGLAPVKLNTVVLRGWNDEEVVDLVRWALDADCHIRFIELMPLGPAKKRYRETFVSGEEVRRRLESVFEMHPLPFVPGGSARMFEVSDGQGRRGLVGFITPQSHPFCASCARLRLTSTGELVGCLAQGSGWNIRPLLRRDGAEEMAELLSVVRRVLESKRRCRGFVSTRPMAAVGG